MSLRIALLWSLPLLVRPAGVSAQDARPLPAFRATDVRVLNDTAWFFDPTPAEHAVRHPLVGYVPATGEWITAARRWRTIDTLVNHRARSGPVTTDPNETQDIGSGFRIVDGRRWNDSLLSDNVFLVAPGGRRVSTRLTLPAAARRALYGRGGGRVSARARAPVFERVPEWWAASNGRVVLAFAGNRPPARPWHWTQERDVGQWKYPVRMSGVLVIDSATLRATSLAHSALIERDWVGLELVGNAVYVAPDSLNDDRYENHAAAKTHTPRLARYDLDSGRWKIFTPSELPTGDAPVKAIAADDRHVYLATEVAVAALDVRRGTWSTRFYADSDIVLADDADSTVTYLRSKPPRVAVDSTADDPDAVAMATLLRRLMPRHRRAFAARVLDLVPRDSLTQVSETPEEERRRTIEYGDFDDPFGSSNNLMMQHVLARRELEPFLREMARNAGVLAFALGALRLLGDEHVVSALRSVLDSGSAPAANRAADSLLARGDSTALVWLRRRVAEVDRPVEFEPSVYEAYGWPFRHVVSALATRDDTLSLPSLIALLDRPASKLAERAQGEILEALVQFRSPAARIAIARAVAERPWLQQRYAELAR